MVLIVVLFFSFSCKKQNDKYISIINLIIENPYNLKKESVQSTLNQRMKNVINQNSVVFYEYFKKYNTNYKIKDIDYAFTKKDEKIVIVKIGNHDDKYRSKFIFMKTNQSYKLIDIELIDYYLLKSPPSPGHFR